MFNQIDSAFFKFPLFVHTVCAVVVFFMTQSSAAADEADRPFYDSYQMALLYQPTEAELEMEQQGRVNIYVGMTDKQVDRAMDTQFERIDSMMFASVIVTDETGSALKDPETGEVYVEEDGCD